MDHMQQYIDRINRSLSKKDQAWLSDAEKEVVAILDADDFTPEDAVRRIVRLRAEVTA